VRNAAGWHRQAQLGDGGFAMRKTIVKAFGLDDATRHRRRRHPQGIRFRDFAFALRSEAKHLA
jgi:hypothetical protein